MDNMFECSDRPEILELDRQLECPVLFLVFNRPELTAKVFEKIREARPAKLYVVADGPRFGNQKDKVLCEQTRNVINAADWGGEVITLFRNENLGCRKSIMTGIDWFFQQEEYGIILEDDCLPEKTFFPFCQMMLKRYANDIQVMQINGNNYGSNQFSESGCSYHFTRAPQIWGWATWRRAWDLYDPEMRAWRSPSRKEWIKSIGWSWSDRIRQELIYERMLGKDTLDTWDYQWLLTVYSNKGLAVAPKQNQITNIGFGDHATHTQETVSPRSGISTEPMDLKVVHPRHIDSDPKLDRMYWSMGGESILRLLIRKASRTIKSIPGHLNIFSRS